MTAAQPVPVGGHQVGLPAGVFLAPLGRRLGAFAIDALVPYVLVVAGLLSRNSAPGWLSMILYVVAACWVILVLVMVALKAAGPGMQLLRLQIVGLHDGRPVGFGRALLRGVILGALTVTGVGLIICGTVMVLQTRHQGWHDHAVGSVVIGERPLAPPRPHPQPAMTDRPAAAAAAPESSHGDRVDLVEDSASAGPSLPDPDAYWAQRQQQEREEEERLRAERAQHALHEAALRASEQQRADQSSAAESPSVESHVVEPQVAAAAAEPLAAQGSVDPTQPGPAADQGWVVVLEDGREIVVQRLILIGRNPQPQSGEEDARLIKIMDEARMVSKTHLSVSVDAQGVAVTDRGSTNGSAITAPNGDYELLTPGQPRWLPEPGYLVSFGKHHIRIGRRS